VRATALQTPRSAQKEGRRCSRHQNRGSLQPVEQTVVRQAVPCSHGGPWWSRSPPVARGEPHAGAGGCPKEAVTPWGAPCWSRLLPGPVALWREEPMPEQFLKDCTPWEGPTLEKSVQNCLPREGPHAGAGAQGEESSPEEEGAADPMCDELTAAPIPRPPRRAGGGGRETGVKLSLGRTPPSWERCF